MKVTLRVWRQAGPEADGSFEEHDVDGVNEEMSFLEMMDVLNDRLVESGDEPIEFESDCREGICGTCNLVIDGVPHGPQLGTATCQLHMRKFDDGARITVEPWRAAGFPMLKDLIVDRTHLDDIVAAGGYVSVNTGKFTTAPLFAAEVSERVVADLAGRR